MNNFFSSVQSFSAISPYSGMNHDATAFIGCDQDKVNYSVMVLVSLRKQVMNRNSILKYLSIPPKVSIIKSTFVSSTH